ISRQSTLTMPDEALPEPPRPIRYHPMPAFRDSATPGRHVMTDPRPLHVSGPGGAVLVEPLDQQFRDGPELGVNVAVWVEGHPSHPDGLVEQAGRRSCEPYRNHRAVLETVAKLFRFELRPDALWVVRPQKGNDERRL